MNINVFKNKTILIAEDDVNSRLLLREFLSHTGAKLIFAADGQEAVDLAKLNNPDVVLMDYKLPVLDGYKASKAIKAFLKAPVIAQTASILNEETKSKLNNYFDNYILKPYSQNDLIEMICYHLEKINV